MYIHSTVVRSLLKIILIHWNFWNLFQMSISRLIIQTESSENLFCVFPETISSTFFEKDPFARNMTLLPTKFQVS